MSSMNEFIEWEQKVKPEIGHIGFILSQKLSDEPEALIKDLIEVESWNGRVGFLLAESNSWLDRFALTAMPPKEQGKTELDRETLLDSETAPIRLVRDILEHYCDAIKNRLVLGESILGYQRQFANGNKDNFKVI